MKKKVFVWFIVCTAIISTVIIVSAMSMSRKPSQKPEVYVAIVSSLTGDLAENGKDVANGAKLAFDQSNSVVGNNENINYEIFDDQGEPKMAVSIANRICQDSRFLAVVGHLTSGCMSAAASVYDHAGIPVVMPVPTNPKITQQGYTFLFRVPPTDDDQAPFLAKYLITKDPKASVAVIHDLTAYGMGFAEAFRHTFDSSGGNIVMFEGAQKQTRDFRSLIAKIKELSPKYVLLGATYDMGAPFVRQMKELGLISTPVSGDGCYGSAFLEQAGSAAEGTIVSFIAPDRASSPITKKFFDEYEAKYGKVVSFAPLGYDAAKVIVAAIRKSSSKTRKGIWHVIREKNFIVKGVTGQIEFEENGDNKNKNLVLYIVHHGKFVLLK